MAVDVHTRQVVALCAVGSACVSMGAFIGCAVAAWSWWFLLFAAASALLGAVVSVVAIPRDPPRIVLMPAPPLNTWTRVEVSGLRPGDKIVMSNRPTEETP